MKLYVWRYRPNGHELGPLNPLPDHGCGLMVALANDAEEARRLLRKENPGAADAGLGHAPEVFDAPVGVLVWGSS